MRGLATTSARPPHLLVALTAHGFGHAAMTAPVVNAVAQRLPGLRLTVQSDHRPDWLSARFAIPYEQIDGPDDFGLKMIAATEIDREATARAYRELHGRLDQAVGAQARRMAERGVDLVLANIGYVPLLAARRAGIPAIALSCLNWADIYGHCFAGQADTATLVATMQDAYRSARVFLRTAPAMPMPFLPHCRDIGPIAALGQGDRTAIRRRLGVPDGTRLGLVAFGGVASAWSMADWPRLDGWRWIVTGDPGGHPDLIAYDRDRFDFTEMMRSCDLVVTKPGYGTFTEAAVNGVPVLFVERPEWPESRPLISWLRRYGRCRAASAEALFDPQQLTSHLRAVLAGPAKSPVVARGAAIAASTVARALRLAVSKPAVARSER